jgi:hypothetical protein
MLEELPAEDFDEKVEEEIGEEPQEE